MEIEKVHIQHCMLYYFHCQKSVAETCKIICKTYGEQLYLKVRANPGFKGFKVEISTLMTNLDLDDLKK